MKYFRQLAIIFLVCVIGQVLSLLIGGVVPGNVFAMIVLFLLLLTGIVKMEAIAATADFILVNMAFFFLPATVAIVDSYDLFVGNIIKVLLVCIIATILTSLSAGLTVKYVLRWQKRRRKVK